MLIPFIVTGCINNDIIGTETGQSVNVRISIISGQPAMIQPEHAMRAKQRSQRLLDLTFIQLRVAIGRKQACRGSQDSAEAITLQASSLHNQADRVQTRNKR